MAIAVVVCNRLDSPRRLQCIRKRHQQIATSSAVALNAPVRAADGPEHPHAVKFPYPGSPTTSGVFDDPGVVGVPS